MNDATAAPVQADTVHGEQETQQQEKLLGTETPQTQGAEHAKEQPVNGETAGEGKKEEPKGAPEKYELKPPEGIALDEETVQAFEPIARELGLSNEQAQKLADFYCAKQAEIPAQLVRKAEELEAQWAEAARKDKEYGGDSFDRSIGLANSALKALDTDGSITKMLAETRMLNNPEMIRLLVRVGSKVTEDQAPGGNWSAGRKSPAETLYPGMK